MAFSDMADDAIPRGRLRGKVAVITGASYGIGRGLAMRFAREGARLVLCSRTASRAGEMLDELRAITPAVHYVPADVGIRSEIEHVIAEAARVYGRVDALVNNAQTVMPWTPLEDKPDDDWQQTLQSGLQATLWAMRAAFPLMKAQGGGRIVNFGSIFGVNGSRWAADYAPCKEAIRGLTRTAANEWAATESPSTWCCRPPKAMRRKRSSRTIRPRTGSCADACRCIGTAIRRPTSAARSSAWLRTKGASSPARLSFSMAGSASRAPCRRISRT